MCRLKKDLLIGGKSITCFGSGCHPDVVEVKRSSDTRTRQEVVGQMLDYAANATRHWPSSKMREVFTANCKSMSLDPEEKLIEFLEGETEPEDFWQMADKNLKERRLRLLFVADAIPSELRNIVEFLNDQMDRTQVLAIEIKHYVSGQGLRSLAPRVIGQTAKAEETKSLGTRTTTTEEEFFSSLEDSFPEAADVARRILNWSRDHFTLVEWQGVLRTETELWR